MQNKPNLLTARMNVGSVMTKDYEQPATRNQRRETRGVYTELAEVSNDYYAKQTQFMRFLGRKWRL